MTEEAPEQATAATTEAREGASLAPAGRAPVPPAQIALAVLALVVVALVIVALNDGGDDAATTTLPPISAPATSAPEATSPEGGGEAPRAEWPLELSGRPRGLGERNQPATEVQVAPGTASAVYLWSDFDGWHLWAVGGALPPIRGTLSSNDTIAKADLAVPGVGSVTPADKAISFELPGDAPLSGIDFNPGFFAQQLVLTLEGPDGPLPLELIRLGEAGAEAPFPLVFDKAPR